MIYRNRRDGGRYLASKLSAYADCRNVIMLALPRVGVPGAFEIAQALHAPLDVFLVRKLGVPGHEQLAMGAIASWGARVLNDDVVRALRIPSHVIETVAARECRELDRRARKYCAGRPAPNVRGQTVILVDDGLATASTMRAAIAAIKQQGPARVVVAVPVGAPETCAEFQLEADEAICAVTPEPFYAVGTWYQDFSQTTDEEVQTLLDEAAAMSRPAPHHGATANH